jgi:ribosomal protein S12 methylthiotransferase
MSPSTAGGCAAPSVYFLTLGCPKNEVDTDRMKAAVLGSAFGVAEDPDAADVVVVNTCSFIQDATEESIQTILDVSRSWLPAREGRKLVVAGCMPSRYGADLAESMPEVDAFLPVVQEDALLDVLERLTGVPARSGVRDAAPDSPACPPRTASGPSAYLQVSDGCHLRCSYCTIPSIRGPYRSRPLDEIVEEARFLLAGGAREIVLIGQDISSYGRDLGAGAPALADVVRAVARVENLAWLRLMYVQPDGITQELLEVIASEPAVCHYLDMPLQHASASVLKRMRRRGSAAEFLRLIERIRATIPDIVLRTSLIAGFPGETRDDVRELEQFLEDARLDYVGVFSYSPEDGTPAASMPDLPTKRTRLRRAQRLRDVADRVGFEKAANRVGETLDVLVEGRRPRSTAECSSWMAGRSNRARSCAPVWWMLSGTTWKWK